MTKPLPDRAYWDGVGDEWRRRRPDALWREFTDRLQLELFDRLIGRSPGGRRPRLLKTDLFDEVAGRGLVGGLSARGFAVTGVDLAPVVVTEAVARNAGLEALPADVRSLPFAAGTFDAVFSGSTLDHFESETDIGVAIRELGRVLRPGGRLLLTLDNPGNPLVWLRNGPLAPVVRGLGIVPYQVGATLHRRPLAAVLQAAGFDLRRMTAVLHCPRVIAVAAARPVACGGQAMSEAFLRLLGACEVLERLPTRWLTGHYLAVEAVRLAVDPVGLAADAVGLTADAVGRPSPPAG